MNASTYDGEEIYTPIGRPLGGESCVYLDPSALLCDASINLTLIPHDHMGRYCLGENAESCHRMISKLLRSRLAHQQ